MRRKRWLRDGVYAVDGYDIVIPYRQGYELFAGGYKGPLACSAAIM